MRVYTAISVLTHFIFLMIIFFLPFFFIIYIVGTFCMNFEMSRENKGLTGILTFLTISQKDENFESIVAKGVIAHQFLCHKVFKNLLLQWFEKVYVCGKWLKPEIQG